MEKRLRFKCRVEGKVQEHIMSDEGGSLPFGVYLAQCCSCGVMGIENADPKALLDEPRLPEGHKPVNTEKMRWL